LLGAGDGQLTVLGDTAYGTGELREHLQASGHLAVIKPPPLPRAIPGGFTIDDFTIDDHAATVTCPAGRTVALGRPQADGNRRVPYRGVTKNNTWLHHRAAALNLRRLVNLGLTHTSDGNWALA